MKLPEGYHALRVPIPNNPLGFLLSYLIVGRNGHTLIDAGWDAPEAYQSLIDQLSALGLELRDIEQIILTHMHPDHSGLANQIRRESGAKVISHKMEASMHHQPSDEAKRFLNEPQSQRFESYGVPAEIYQNSRFGRRTSFSFNWPEPDEVLSGGEVIEAGDLQLEVVWTPGHAQGHICLYDRKNRVLFSGDHVLPITTPHVSLLFSADDRRDPLGDYLDSLAKLKPLEVDVVLPAHDHIFADLSGRLQEIEEHHEARLREMQGAAEGRWTTPFDVARNIVWTIGSFDSLEDSHKVMAVGETLAHLEFMEKRGRVSKKSDEGVLHYRAG